MSINPTPSGHDTVMLNGEALPAAEAKIPALSDGLLFGAGVFTTLRVHAGKLMFWEEHWTRLTHSAAELGLTINENEKAAKLRARLLVLTNGVREGVLKIAAFAGPDGPMELIQTRSLPYSDADYARGFRLKSFRSEGPAGGVLGRHKTLNYYAHLRAKRAAVAEGFDEAVWMHADGRLLEGATTNVFVVHNSIVCTPPLNEGILPGIARHILVSLPGQEQLIREVPISAEFLLESEEVFITNSILGVMPVSAIDGQTFDLNANPVTRAIKMAYRHAEAQALNQPDQDSLD